MLDFKEKFIENNKINQFKAIILYGENESQIKLILEILKKHFGTIQQIDNKQLNDNKGLVENILLTNDIFSEKEIYLIEKIDEKHLKSTITTIKKFIDKTQNVFIITILSKANFGLKDEKILTIQCNNLSEKEKYKYIAQEIQNYKIKLSDEQIKFLSNILRKEDIFSIKNELHKLYIFSIDKDGITNKEIEILFDIPNNEEMHSLLRAVIYRDVRALEIADNIINNYSPLYLIISIYRYFFNLSKVMILIKFKKNTFEEATKKIYGILVDYDIAKLKSHLRYFKIPIISKILRTCLKVEVQVKVKPHMARASCIKFIYDLISDLIPKVK